MGNTWLMLMELIKETQLIIVSQCSCLIAYRLHLVLKINLSGLPALERWGLPGGAAGADWKHAFIFAQILGGFICVCCVYVWNGWEVHLASVFWGFFLQSLTFKSGSFCCHKSQISELKSVFMMLLGQIKVSYIPSKNEPLLAYMVCYATHISYLYVFRVLSQTELSTK